MTVTDDRVERGDLRIDVVLDRFIADEVLPALGISPGAFWSSVSEIVAKFGPRNRDLLAARLRLQEQLDGWHRDHHGSGPIGEYSDFLRSIGYLEPIPAPFRIDVHHVDAEIATIAGPQLIVPLSNARFALNACNARWGSLYDALYGSDAIAEDDGETRAGNYNAARGEAVIAYVDGFLDEVVPLASGSHREVHAYELSGTGPALLTVTLSDGASTTLRDPSQFAGFAHEGEVTRLLFVNHGLHIELVVDRNHPIGRQNPAGVADVVLESAVTTIQDCEDAVSSVDAEDKVGVYRNWLGLMTGNLEATFEKGGRALTRRLHEDRRYEAPNSASFTLPGRSLLLIRNVGLHMYTDAVCTADGSPIPEGLLDAAVTVAIAMYDLRGLGRFPNSRAASIYVVKPKQHGSAEVAFSAEVFAGVEVELGLPENTIKIGIMDEERRTTLNLAACIAAARERVIFINTGFLDRTGDEIHTAMEAGPIIPKGEIKSAPWLIAYEQHNVDVGLAAGFRGMAQIGKGMWAMPDAMADMVAQKIAHPRAGASCAWVPSPTAATLHAMHYHYVDVAARQEELASAATANEEDLFELPLLTRTLSGAEIAAEISNNAQGILGYVVRWVNQGIGCSKVPDIHGVALMEDRATLRISSQHIANWLRHGIIDEDRVRSTFYAMAELVDAQNTGDPEYRPMMPHPETSAGVLASLDLIFSGTQAPNGYTEPVLNAWRSKVKAGEA